MKTLVVGRITAVFGVRGWVKVHAYTEKVETLCSYQPWLIDTPAGVKPIQIDEWRRHGESLVAHIAGIDDRDIRAADQIVPVGRFDVMSDTRQRIDIRLPHCDDFFFQANLHLAKRRINAAGFFPL